MDYESVAGLVASVGFVSTVCLAYGPLANEVRKSVIRGFEARCALKNIAVGDDPRNHEYIFSDVKTDGCFGLANRIMGGDGAIDRAVKEGSDKRKVLARLEGNSI